jgi:hypothetical protein
MTTTKVRQAAVRLRKCNAGYRFPCNGECGMARQCMATVRAISPTCTASRPVMDANGVCTGRNITCTLPKGHGGDHHAE